MGDALVLYIKDDDLCLYAEEPMGWGVFMDLSVGDGVVHVKISDSIMSGGLSVQIDLVELTVEVAQQGLDGLRRDEMGSAQMKRLKIEHWWETPSQQTLMAISGMKRSYLGGSAAHVKDVVYKLFNYVSHVDKTCFALSLLYLFSVSYAALQTGRAVSVGIRKIRKYFDERMNASKYASYREQIGELEFQPGSTENVIIIACNEFRKFMQKGDETSLQTITSLLKSVNIDVNTLRDAVKICDIMQEHSLGVEGLNESASTRSNVSETERFDSFLEDFLNTDIGKNFKNSVLHQISELLVQASRHIPWIGPYVSPFLSKMNNLGISVLAGHEFLDTVCSPTNNSWLGINKLARNYNLFGFRTVCDANSKMLKDVSAIMYGPTEIVGGILFLLTTQKQILQPMVYYFLRTFGYKKDDLRMLFKAYNSSIDLQLITLPYLRMKGMLSESNLGEEYTSTNFYKYCRLLRKTIDRYEEESVWDKVQTEHPSTFDKLLKRRNFADENQVIKIQYRNSDSKTTPVTRELISHVYRMIDKHNNEHEFDTPSFGLEYNTQSQAHENAFYSFMHKYDPIMGYFFKISSISLWSFCKDRHDRRAIIYDNDFSVLVNAATERLRRPS